jgi:SAM-dependent methyltransferase
MDERALNNAKWRRVPIEWINALRKTGSPHAAPARILVAGCGTGREAFQMQRRFPEAEIVAVDFSPRSISIARALQQGAAKMRRIRFLVDDLTRRGLSKTLGDKFDFISCHGVLSYVPEPDRALANLADSLSPNGILYLGVNGTQHSSVSGRKFLPKFGFDMTELRDGPGLRRLLKLYEAILGLSGRARLSNKTSGYLAGDLFGPLIHNLPLANWLRIARNARLHFQSAYSCHYALRLAMEKDFPQLLIPRSRPEICELLEILHPAAFHRLLFTRQPELNPPWEKHDALLTWRPTLTNLYTVRLPKRSRSWKTLRKVTFKSVATNTRLDWQMPEWEIEIVRQSDGQRTIGTILDGIPVDIRPGLLRQQLYIFHQLLVVTLSAKSLLEK